MENNEYNPEAIQDGSINPPEPTVGDTASDLIHAGQRGANNVNNLAHGINNMRKPKNSEGELPDKKGSPNGNNMPGQVKNKPSNDLDKQNNDGNNNLNSNKDNAAKGVNLPKSNDKNKSPNASNMPGVKKNDNKTKENKNIKKPESKEKGNKLNKKGAGKNRFMPALGGLNPLNRKKKDGRPSASESQSGEKERSAGAGAASFAGNLLGKVLNKLPVQYRVIAYVALPIAAVLITILIILAIFLTTIVTTMTSDSCNESSYGAAVGNSPDMDTFMCAMNKPLKNITVTSLYGWRNFNLGHMHNGVDLGASCGTAVYAVADGEVIFAGSSSGYGNVVQIRHVNGITTWYAHLSRQEVSKGQKVKAGDEIAKSGNTGGNYPCHLHLEVRKNETHDSAVSPNQYFGYSDKGYEHCFNRNKPTRNCGFSESGSARKIKKSEQSGVCTITSSYFNEGDNSECCETTEAGTSTSLVDFLTKFEGGGKNCKTSKGNEGYLAENLGDGAVTAGPGITNAPVKSSEAQTIILSSSDKSAFVMSGGKYIMKVGSCYSKDTIDKIFMNSLEKSYGAAASKSAQKYSVNLNAYEKDAITSLNYNLGSGYSDKFVKAYKDDGYKGFWNSIKNLVHSGGKELSGLKKRRKAEFALFVTGDYTDKGLFYSRNLNNYDDYDSEGVMARKASGSSSTCTSSASGDKKAVIDAALKELDAWNKASGSTKSSMRCKYGKACGQGCGIPWCAAFVNYVLKEAGVMDQIGLKKSCLAHGVLHGNKGVVTIHKAGGNYTPQPGDLITFDYDHNGTANHIGLVEKVEGKTVHTIEGNTSNAIKKRTYPIDSSSIFEYGSY